MLNNWQKWKLIKYKVKEEDLKSIPMVYCVTTWEKGKKNPQILGFKHYTCNCWTLELLWFIDKFQNKCRDCAWFVKN